MLEVRAIRPNIQSTAEAADTSPAATCASKFVIIFISAVAAQTFMMISAVFSDHTRSALDLVHTQWVHEVAVCIEANFRYFLLSRLSKSRQVGELFMIWRSHKLFGHFSLQNYEFLNCLIAIIDFDEKFGFDKLIWF